MRAIGAAAARTALRRLGESRRGLMLADTEAAFRRLAGGVWSRLDTWVQGQDERLVGISEERSVPADVTIAFPDETEIIDFSLSTEPKIGFDDLQSKTEAHMLHVSTKLLNVSDKITVEIISTGNSSDSVEVAMRNRHVEEEIVDARTGDFGLSFLLSERNLLMLAVVSTIPFFGGFARSMINVGVANRIDNLSKQKN